MSDSETNGNLVGEHRGPTGSVEDVSEYTDADESISAPTEILAEFLSSIMLKDYETALKYCKLILHYEPNNSTAREFYPLIMEKIGLMNAEESENESSSDLSESGSSYSSNSSVEESEKSTDSDATSASYSSLEDEEADRENNVKEQGSCTSSFTSNDIANGNTSGSHESTHERGIFTSALNKIGSEQLKRKLKSVFRRKSTISLTENKKIAPTSQRRASNNNNNLTLTPNPRRSNRFHEDARNRTCCSHAVKSCCNSPKHNFDQVDNAKYPIWSSDSESVTDQTVHEATSKGCRAAGK